jgi:hypothetical protein
MNDQIPVALVEGLDDRLGQSSGKRPECLADLFLAHARGEEPGHVQDSGLAAIVGVLQSAEFLGKQWGGWMVSHSNSLQPRAIGYEKTPGPYGSERLNAGALKKLVLRTCANANVAQGNDASRVTHPWRVAERLNSSSARCALKMLSRWSSIV